MKSHRPAGASVLLLSLLASGPAASAGLPEAQRQVWRTTGPTCGSVSFLRATPALGPILWTGFAYGGAIFRSDDLGGAWRETGRIDPGLWVEDVIFEPDAPSRGYASTFGEGVLGTLDGGRHWKKLEEGPTTDLLGELQLDGQGRLYVVSTYEGLWRSADHGDSWEELLYTEGNLYDLAIDPDVPGRLVVATTFERILLSDDDGRTWRRADRGLDDVPWRLAWDREARPRLWAAVERGEIYRWEEPAWQRIGGIGYISIFALVFDPRDNRTIWVGSADGLYRSVDEGETWQLVAFEGEIVRELLWVEGPRPRFLAGTDDGVYQSFTGERWRKTSHGLNDARIRSLAVADDSQLVYAGSDNCLGRILTSPDGGRSWRTSEPLASFGSASEEAGAIVVQPGDPSRAVAGLASRVFETVDSGRNWAERGTPLTSSIQGLAMERSWPGLLFASSSSAVWRSADHGERWESVLSDYPLDNFRGIDIANGSNGVWVGADRHGVGPVVSFDHGDSWQPRYAGFQCTGGAGIVTVDPFDPSTIYAGCGSSGGLRRSDDRGLSWQIVDFDSAHGVVVAIAADPTRKGHLYVAAQGGLFQSCDGGVRWREVDDFPAVAWRLAIGDDGALHVGARWRGVYSTDSGELAARCRP